MGRKRRNPEANMETAAEVGLRAVRLELPEDVHKLLRLEAAKQDVSLGALARIAVEDYLKRKAGGK
jgi:predicted HicB family RNase H-like nuclease